MRQGVVDLGFLYADHGALHESEARVLAEIDRCWPPVQKAKGRGAH